MITVLHGTATCTLSLKKKQSTIEHTTDVGQFDKDGKVKFAAQNQTRTVDIYMYAQSIVSVYQLLYYITTLKQTS